MTLVNELTPEYVVHIISFRVNRQIGPHIGVSMCFNEFFNGIGPSLAKKIPKQSLSPLHHLRNPMVQSIFLTELTANDINKIIQCLKNGAAGHDDITASSVKLVSVAIN